MADRKLFVIQYEKCGELKLLPHKGVVLNSGNLKDSTDKCVGSKIGTYWALLSSDGDPKNIRQQLKDLNGGTFKGTGDGYSFEYDSIKYDAPAHFPDYVQLAYEDAKKKV